MAATGSKPLLRGGRARSQTEARRRIDARLLTASGLGVVAALAATPALAQRWDLGFNVSTTVEASTNQDLLPSGEENPGARLIFSPGFFVSGTAPGGRLQVNGSGSLGAQLQLSTEEDDSGAFFRPNGSLIATLEAIDNFFFVEARAQAVSQLDSPFLASTDNLSGNNTSTSYQFGVAPRIQGRLPYDFDYVVRSDNSWTNFTDSDLQFASTNSVNIERRPQPWGGVFNYTQSLVASDLPGQGNLVSDVARISLRYALNSNLALGARAGAEKYNFALDPSNRSWQRYYGAEVGWNPNDRTSFEGYWEDRLFGNAWQARFSYRRPRTAFTFSTSRQLTSTPQQFLSIPGQASLSSLLDASFTTRIPDPIERQRAVDEALRNGQVPSELLAPVIINSEGFQITENSVATAVLNGKRDSLSFSVFYNSTTSTPGISSQAPIVSKTRQRGAQISYGRQLMPRVTMNGSASWRNTVDELDTESYTTQTQFLLNMSWSLARRTSATLGARYQWITSTATNDATEAALFATIAYTFD